MKKPGSIKKEIKRIEGDKAILRLEYQKTGKQKTAVMIDTLEKKIREKLEDTAGFEKKLEEPVVLVDRIERPAHRKAAQGLCRRINNPGIKIQGNLPMKLHFAVNRVFFRKFEFFLKLFCAQTDTLCVTINIKRGRGNGIVRISNK